MLKPDSLKEQMDMPNPHFPIKVHQIRTEGYGRLLFPTHWHAHVEILVFVQGEASITCGSETYQAQAGDVIFVNSNELHYGVSQSNDLFYYAVIMDVSLLFGQKTDAAQVKFISPIIGNLLLFQNRIREHPAIRDCLSELIEELGQQKLGFELSVKSCLYRLFTMMVREHVRTVLTPRDSSMRMSNLERLTPVLNFIENSYGEKLSVDRLAEMAGLSRFHFSRIFKSLTGCTLTEYIHQIRINHAEYLLLNSPLTVSEVALAAGFADIFYFSRIFKRYKGKPPSLLKKGGHQ